MSVDDILFEFGTVGALSKEEATHAIKQIIEDQMIAYQKELFKDYESDMNEARIKELQYILDNSSGGGSWRRVIMERIEQIKGKS